LKFGTRRCAGFAMRVGARGFTMSVKDVELVPFAPCCSFGCLGMRCGGCDVCVYVRELSRAVATRRFILTITKKRSK
jgi:hypothetical protein